MLREGSRKQQEGRRVSTGRPLKVGPDEECGEPMRGWKKSKNSKRLSLEVIVTDKNSDKKLNLNE